MNKCFVSSRRKSFVSCLDGLSKNDKVDFDGFWKVYHKTWMFVKIFWASIVSHCCYIDEKWNKSEMKYHFYVCSLLLTKKILSRITKKIA